MSGMIGAFESEVGRFQSTFGADGSFQGEGPQSQAGTVHGLAEQLDLTLAFSLANLRLDGLDDLRNRQGPKTLVPSPDRVRHYDLVVKL